MLSKEIEVQRDGIEIYFDTLSHTQIVCNVLYKFKKSSISFLESCICAAKNYLQLINKKRSMYKYYQYMHAYKMKII